MKNVKRIVTGLLFAATLAVSLTASGGQAYAQAKTGQGQTHNSAGGITLPTPATTPLQTLGITWE